MSEYPYPKYIRQTIHLYEAGVREQQTLINVAKRQIERAEARIEWYEKEITSQKALLGDE